MKLKKPRLPLMVRQVQGHSMVPVLPPGTIVWARRWFSSLRPGDVVVLLHADKEKIKRVTEIKGNRIYVLGEHAETSTDSRHFGWLDINTVMAKLVWPRVPKKWAETE